MKNNVRKKPTAKEMAGAIIEINSRVTECMQVLRNLDNVLGLYIKMNGDKKKFNAYIEEIIAKRKEKEDVEKKNGKIDNPNIQGDTDSKSSRPKGIRAKSQ